MFDDFSYSGVNDSQLRDFNKWTIVDGVNGPPSNAQYSKNNISFVEDPAVQGNTFMTLSTTVNGATRATTHARIETVGYEYFEGTYSARMYCTDNPYLYQDANIQTFYTIVSYLLGGDGSRYSEIDFEYMASDYWGTSAQNKVMYMTSWNRYIAEPWQAWKNHFTSLKSFEGWHVFTFSCTNKRDVKFWIDNVYIGSMAYTDNDGSSVYPRNPMQVAFANWIWNNRIGASTNSRKSTMQVDWTIFIKDQEWTPQQVGNKVSEYRSGGLQRRNLAGQEFVSASNKAPQVSLSNPANGGVFVAPAAISISANASDADGSIASVEFFQGTTRLGIDMSAPYTFDWTSVPAGTYQITALAKDNAGAYTRSSAVQVTVQVPQGPYSGSPAILPGIIEAENYDLGGAGQAYSDVSPGNSGGAYRTQEAVDIEPTSGGGYNLGYVQAGEWLEYTVSVASSGNYTLAARVATNVITVNEFRLENASQALCSIRVPFTGGWQQWSSVQSSAFYLEQGVQVLRVYFVSGQCNIDRMTIGLAAENQLPTIQLTSPVTGTSLTQGASLSLQAEANDADGTIRKVDFYLSNGTLLGSDLSAPFTCSPPTNVAGSYTWYAKATDNLGGESTSETRTYTINAATWSLKIEAEQYTYMGGIQTETCIDAGGGLNVGYVDATDWMSYQSIVFPTAGTYQVEYRVASVMGGGVISLDLNAGSIWLGSVTVPSTGGWQNWTTVQHAVTIPASGTYHLGIYAPSGAWNLNWIQLTKLNTASMPQPTITANQEANQATFEAKVFPNPATDHIYVELPTDQKITTIWIVDVTGKKVIETSEMEIDIQGLPSGTYWMHVQGERYSKPVLFHKNFY